MPMDAVFLHGLTQELTQSLTGARIDKGQQPARSASWLYCSGTSSTCPGVRAATAARMRPMSRSVLPLAAGP